MSDSARKKGDVKVQCAKCKYEKLGYCGLWAKQVAVYSTRVCKDFTNKHK